MRRFTKFCPSAAAARRWAATTGSAAAPLIVGDRTSSLPIRRPEDSHTTITDIIGLSTVGTEIVHRLPAGEILGLMDICAARTAAKHVTGSSTGAKSLEWGKSEVGVATVAAGNTTFKFPLLHGDSVQLVGTVVNVGKTSVTVHIETSRLAFPTRKKQLVSESTFTMVVIEKSGSDGIVSKGGLVPPLEITDGTHRRWHDESVCARKWQASVNNEFERLRNANLTAKDLMDEALFEGRRLVSFESTKTTANRLFFPQHLNLNKTIFGGEVIRWMELNASHCGRLFTGNKNVFSIGMHSVEFRHPIMLTDWVSLEATVVYVHRTTLEVDVEVFIERPGEPLMTNKASFVLTNFDEVGIRKEIMNGLDLESASPEYLHKYACARHRYKCRHPIDPQSGTPIPFMQHVCPLV